ncbi:hypothetical protein DFH28DRAFT_838307, partial [Melampsora americana]
MMTRLHSELNHVPIPPTADPRVAEGQDQCYQCSLFGHVYTKCAFYASRTEALYPPTEKKSDWRRVMPINKTYSLRAL